MTMVPSIKQHPGFHAPLSFVSEREWPLLPRLGLRSTLMLPAHMLRSRFHCRSVRPSSSGIRTKLQAVAVFPQATPPMVPSCYQRGNLRMIYWLDNALTIHLETIALLLWTVSSDSFPFGRGRLLYLRPSKVPWGCLWVI